jgi:hypothetical protein
VHPTNDVDTEGTPQQIVVLQELWVLSVRQKALLEEGLREGLQVKKVKFSA